MERQAHVAISRSLPFCAIQKSVNSCGKSVKRKTTRKGETSFSRGSPSGKDEGKSEPFPLDTGVSRDYTYRNRGLFCLSSPLVCVVCVRSDLTRCSRYGPWFVPSQLPTRQISAWRGTRCSSAPNSSWLRSVVCCIGEVLHLLIRAVKAFGPRCCPWSAVPGSTPSPITFSLAQRR